MAINPFPAKGKGLFIDDFCFQVSNQTKAGLLPLCVDNTNANVEKQLIKIYFTHYNAPKAEKDTSDTQKLQKCETSFVSFDVPAPLELAGLDMNDEKRPDGATIISWSKGKCIILYFK